MNFEYKLRTYLKETEKQLTKPFKSFTMEEIEDLINDIKTYEVIKACK